MITVWGGGLSRSFRVVWLLEEMQLPYQIRAVDLLADTIDPAFLAVNPGGFLPAMQDGEVTMVESVAIMEYLMGRYGPTPLAPAADDPAFPDYQQFLHLGEAGLAMAAYVMIGARQFAPESDRNSWSAQQAAEQFQTRLGFVTRRLARSAHLAGDRFTAADISVLYALKLAATHAGVTLGAPELAYMQRLGERDAYKRAWAQSQANIRPNAAAPAN